MASSRTTPPVSSVRRRALLTTAWAAPAAIATTAAPAVAASPPECPTLRVERGSWLSLEFTGVTKDGKWQSNSRAYVEFSLGDAKDHDWGALAFTSDQNDVLVSARAYVFTLTWEIDMTVTARAGWNVTKTRSGTQYTYTFTYTGSPITKFATTPLGNEPDGHSNLTFIRPVPFTVSVRQNQFNNGQTVSDGRRDYPYAMSYRVEYDVDVPGNRCDLMDQVFTSTSSNFLRPD